MTIQELNQLIIDNFTDDNGDVDISGMEFNCNADMSSMKVKGDLFQNNHKVDSYLFQNGHEVRRDLSQSSHKVRGDLYQYGHEVEGDLYQSNHEVKGDKEDINEITEQVKKYVQEKLYNLNIADILHKVDYYENHIELLAEELISNLRESENFSNDWFNRMLYRQKLKGKIK